MIVVTSVRTDIAIEVVEGGIFDPDQAVVLKMAYDKAVDALAGTFHLTAQVKAKLARTVLRLGRLSLASGRDLAVDPDVQAIASAASLHLLSANSDHPGRLLIPALPFPTRAGHAATTLRKRDGGSFATEGALSAVTSA